MNKKIGAVIISYNPDKEKLFANIESTLNQVDELLIVDNNSIQTIDWVNDMFKNITLIKNKKNVGIAGALNQGINYFNLKGYNWVLTLDQDSRIEEKYIKKAQQYLFDDKVGIICPLVYDLNDPPNYKLSNSSIELDQCITSGSLTNVNSWKKVNGFDEQMFIDLVDFDFCYRLKKNSFKILQLQNCFIFHEVGNIKKIGPIKVYNHNEFRKYYYIRNWVYLGRKYPEASNLKVTYKILSWMITTLLFEDQKWSKMKKSIKGIIDGFKMEVIHEDKKNNNKS